MYKFPLLLIFIIFPELLIGQQAGSLDLTFDFDGMLVDSPGFVEDRAFAIAQQSDGKIVIAGTSADVGDRRSFVSRYNIDGTIDSTFGNFGTKIFNLQIAIDDNFNCILIQPDGKIMLSGPSGDSNPFSINVVRLHSDGSLDSSFSNNGITIFNFGGSWFPNAMVQDNFGRTLITGTQSNSMYILRLLPDGSQDSSFDSDGIVIPQPQPGLAAKAYSISIDNNTNIIVAGSDQNASNFLFARFDSAGVLDTTFGQFGYVTFPIVGFGSLSDCTIQSDGKIVGAGYFDASGIGNNHDFVLIRINIDGSPDSTFSQDGIFEYPVSTGRDILQSVLVQPDGKILAAGYAQQYTTSGNFALVRLNSDGTLDGSFGTNGLVITDFNGNLDIGSNIILQTDFKIVLCGWTLQSNIWKVAMARYHSGLNVGSNEISENNLKLNVFPNPVADILNIYYHSPSNGKSRIKIFNCFGQSIQILELAHENYDFHYINLFVGNLPKGIYFISIIGDDYNSVKFIKN